MKKLWLKMNANLLFTQVGLRLWSVSILEYPAQYPPSPSLHLPPSLPPKRLMKNRLMPTRASCGGGIILFLVNNKTNDPQKSSKNIGKPLGNIPALLLNIRWDPTS